MSARKLAVLVAGGTGGHLFPAQALGEELRSRGYAIHLMTDERVRDYGKNFPADAVHIIPSATLSLSEPFRIPVRGFRLLRGMWMARQVLKTLQPNIVVGFGGYPSFPPLLAASQLKLPTLLHEQNAVLGRANTRLASRATRIALSYEHTRGIPVDLENKTVVTGNPVRSMVLQHAGVAYPQIAVVTPIQLLVFGGSQGAKFFSDSMPGVLKLLPVELIKRLRLTQQCRAEDLDRTRQLYGAMGIDSDLQTFFSNLPERISKAHLVVSRAGASTIAELGVLGRPAVMVPLPHALDNDQLRNAQSFAAAGAGWVQPQSTLKFEEFAAFLAQKLTDEIGLRKAAAAALIHGRPEAAKSLADLAQSLAIH
jgi:UDP-N-acetylglucosamine--N-acetylmuramyl-(pentapeptide) pyrophosphoryl-undecaprenol N-acetylglucosamine transferase